MEQINFGCCGISTTGDFKGQIRQTFVKIITDIVNVLMWVDAVGNCLTLLVVLFSTFLRYVKWDHCGFINCEGGCKDKCIKDFMEVRTR